MRGLFIVLEAVKSTEKLRQVVKLYKWLKSEGYDVAVTGQYWTEGKIGRNLETLLNGERNPVMEALLFAADRAEHVEKFIKPALEQGKIVICDRYYHSSIAFQTASGLEEGWVREINKHFIKPDIVFYLHQPKGDGEKKNIRTDHDPKIHKQAAEIYEKMARNGELIKIHVNGDSDAVFSEIKRIVSEKLAEKINTSSSAKL